MFRRTNPSEYPQTHSLIFANRRSLCNGPCGYRSRVADSRVQRLNLWAIKVPLWPSGLGVGLWNRRPVTLVAAVIRVRLWVEAPRLGWKWPEPGGSDFKKGGVVRNEPGKRKRLGRSGTFMAEWFRRWTLESATRDRYPHGPLHTALILVFAVFLFSGRSRFTVRDAYLGVRLPQLVQERKWCVRTFWWHFGNTGIEWTMMPQR